MLDDRISKFHDELLIKTHFIILVSYVTDDKAGQITTTLQEDLRFIFLIA